MKPAGQSAQLPRQAKLGSVSDHQQHTCSWEYNNICGMLEQTVELLSDKSTRHADLPKLAARCIALSAASLLLLAQRTTLWTASSGGCQHSEGQQRLSIRNGQPRLHSACRYLFNAGEGFQRFCTEYKIRASRMSGVFLTRSTPYALGGLPGELSASVQ